MNADKMFEELGYKKTCDDCLTIDYQKIETLGNGTKISTEVRFYVRDEMLKLTVYNYEIGPINFICGMQELKAINKKCEELGCI